MLKSTKEDVFCEIHGAALEIVIFSNSCVALPNTADGQKHKEKLMLKIIKAHEKIDELVSNNWH